MLGVEVDLNNELSTECEAVDAVYGEELYADISPLLSYLEAGRSSKNNDYMSVIEYHAWRIS